MGLFASRPEEHDEWAGLPSEPLDPQSEAELLRDAPLAADPAGLAGLAATDAPASSILLGSALFPQAQTPPDTAEDGPSARDEWERTRAVAGRFVEVEHAGSTNADLVAAIAAGEDWPHLGVLLTRDQRSGRGRLDRVWTAPPGAALAVSVVLRVPAIPLALRGWLPLVAGVAMRDAIGAQLPEHEVGLKWPNDVLVAVDGTHRKICGVLAEVASVPDTVVVGTGVNTRLAGADIPVPTGTSFAALGAECDDDRLLADYLTGLDRLLGALAGDDGAVAAVRAEVEAACLTLGRDVSASLPDGSTIRGRADRLAPDGRIVVVPARASSGEGAPSADAAPVALSAADIVHLR